MKDKNLQKSIMMTSGIAIISIPETTIHSGSNNTKKIKKDRFCKKCRAKLNSYNKGYVCFCHFNRNNFRAFTFSKR